MPMTGAIHNIKPYEYSYVCVFHIIASYTAVWDILNTSIIIEWAADWNEDRNTEKTNAKN